MRRRMKAKRTRHYLIPVDGCVEPRAVGPYASGARRDAAARRLRAKQDEDDALFWADVGADGRLTVGAYTAGYLAGLHG